MKILISMILVAAAVTICLPAQAPAQTPKIDGAWQMSMDSPHGQVSGPLEVKQDGVKISGTFAVDGMGTFTFAGKLDGKNISFNLDVPGADHPFVINGTIDGTKMSGKTEMGGAWNAEKK